MIKIAVATRDQMVDDHFGHCESYTVLTIDDNKQITDRQSIPAKSGCGCKSGIANILHKQDVSVLLAGNMGHGAAEKFRIAGIEVFRGCTGPIDQLIHDYLQGSIMDSGVNCGRHEHHHAHGH